MERSSRGEREDRADPRPIVHRDNMGQVSRLGPEILPFRPRYVRPTTQTLETPLGHVPPDSAVRPAIEHQMVSPPYEATKGEYVEISHRHIVIPASPLRVRAPLTRALTLSRAPWGGEDGRSESAA